MEIRHSNYITIQGWMVTQLKLKGIELVAFAVIYGFSQVDGQVYNGNYNYIAKWCNCTKRSVITALQELEKKNLVIKSDYYENNVKYCTYAVNFDCDLLTQGDEKSSAGGENISPEAVKKIHQGGENISPEVVKKNHQGDENFSLTHNNINNNIYNINNNIEKTKKFSRPSVEEVRAFIDENNYHVDPEQFVDYYESVGWKVGKDKPMKNWRSAVRNWERRNNGSNTKYTPKANGVDTF